MKVSFDGFRVNATRDMNNLRDELRSGSESPAIKELFNICANNQNAMNCMYDNDDTDDMNDISLKHEVKEL